MPDGTGSYERWENLITFNVSSTTISLKSAIANKTIVIDRIVLSINPSVLDGDFRLLSGSTAKFGPIYMIGPDFYDSKDGFDFRTNHSEALVLDVTNFIGAGGVGSCYVKGHVRP